MLNRVAFFMIFVLLSNTIVFGLDHEKNLFTESQKDSLSLQTLNQVQAFNYSNKQKELHALVTSQVLENTNYYDSDLQELLFQYLKNLLNEKMAFESYAFIDSLEKKGFFKIRENSWKYCYWLGLCDFVNDHELKGIEKLDITLKLLDSLQWHNSEDLGTIFYYKGLMWQSLGRRDRAYPYYQKAIDLVKNNEKVLFEAYRRISSTLTLQKHHAEALHYINKSIKMVLHGSDESEFNDDVTNILQVPLDRLADLLQSRAYAYRELAKNNKDSLQYLKLSLKDAEKSIVLFEKYKRNLVFESDVLYLNRMYKGFFFKTIEALCRVYEVTGDASLVEKALMYSEMEKVSALIYSIQRSKALYNSNIPPAEVHQMELLNHQLDEVEAKRYEEQANIRINDTALFALNMELYQLVSTISAKEKQLEQAYPEYRSIKYDVEPPKLDYIFELSQKKAIIEFVLSNEKIYTFVVVNGKIHFKHFYYTTDFIAKIERLQKMISNIKEIDFSEKEQKEFVELSADLYNILLKPFEQQIKGKSLLIVPDEQLALIPFEILLKSKANAEKLNYSKLDYLLYHHDISYAYSLTLMQKQALSNANPANHKVFAMAPGYKNLAGNKGSQYIALRNNRDARDNLGMLEGARKEVKMVGKRIKGTCVFDDAASESRFKTEARNYSILHLAMHTLVNNEEPLYSKLVFTPDIDTAEDGLLNTYELANLELDADLVILSACNTGFGKLNKGEGIIGLARGFFQAGCRSLLATLWSVSDKTSLSIIDGFYTELEKQQSKSFSLSESKRNYVKNAKGMWAHPFFWAGYISIGTDEPVQLSTKTPGFTALLLLSGLGLVLLIGLFWLFKVKAGSKSGFQSN
jgi:CHAT domain-containing protein